MAGPASFTLVREARASTALARLALERRRLGRVPGLRFWRLLGTGRGTSTGSGADLRRVALFAVWDDDASHDAFVASRARPGDQEVWHTQLRAIAGHGSWRGFDVVRAVTLAPSDAGPIAVVTRADVRLASTGRFRRASRDVDESLRDADGLLAVVAFGEAPVARLGTFSLWRDTAAMEAWAYGHARHRDVVQRTRTERWYGEELFARFAPYSACGSWDGRDPLARAGSGTSIP